MVSRGLAEQTVLSNRTSHQYTRSSAERQPSLRFKRCQFEEIKFEVQVLALDWNGGSQVRITDLRGTYFQYIWRRMALAPRYRMRAAMRTRLTLHAI